MVDEAEAELFSDHFLQRLKLGINEFDHVAGLDIDQMIMMRLGSGFITRPAITKIMPLKNAGLFKQANSAIHRRDRNARINGGCPRMQRLDVGVILGFRQHTGDNAPLLGDPQAFFSAQRFYINGTMHLR